MGKGLNINCMYDLLSLAVKMYHKKFSADQENTLYNNLKLI